LFGKKSLNMELLQGCEQPQSTTQKCQDGIEPITLESKSEAALTLKKI